MIDYKKRSLQKELLDQNDIPFEDIALNMKELDFINTHLGGHSITIKGFKNLLRNRKEISVCEIGCGGGDNLTALHDFCKKKGIKTSFTGIDINKDCIAWAKANSKIENVDFIISDYKNVHFQENKPGIIFSSLFCHHFTETELIEMLVWMKSNSSLGFFINDLHRHPIAYYFIKIATQLFSKSYLVKNDAPISVLRGFKKNEWKDIFKKAGIKNYSIKWKWAFRYLIIKENYENMKM
jgi:2-polyprenyl-3-methyl-5-hydroxy-6-metoxy-1,4-benzoquinol methylase